MKALLALEDGRTFSCTSFTGPGEAQGEVVFNTSMTGYQEILTDPSYYGQMVTMTYPLIGNYGVCPEDVESDRIHVAAFIVKEYQQFPSNFRSKGTLADYLIKYHVLGIEDLDTRALTRHIRKSGAMRAMISTTDLDPESLVARAKKIPSMEGSDLVEYVTTPKPYLWKDNNPDYMDVKNLEDPAIWRHKGKKHSVVALDFGIKYNIIRCLENAGCEVLVVPAKTDAQTIKHLNPDGIFLSNGPGDPEPLTYIVKTIRELLEHFPVFGICLGMQLLGLAMGGKTMKIKFGHRGGNQPVKNIDTGKVEITSQNHGFAVDLNTLDKNKCRLTHINLNEYSVEGLKNDTMRAFAVQYHPEASPGPHDAAYLFNQFAKVMENAKA
ncbi:MAG TPA: glutamine-hydrolyzing carbamoyl-phosphate synthase small subunit [Desulfobacter postgatei]|jgi:carbamoyl-phosphate synthase small subunit|uniref:glutamine-hydrolyzing carbamoyl-phosphate synthase small subunit n=1 Tax=Desulfobacter sp. TaxID=2294 RepID=UPI000E947F3A|nr:glutamine-hydrolyzing carbamoyl-phosphate synthase small subunit [Desulfobacter sp.]MDQ1269187.1 carbamoyl-phosphate synthase small subunit [Thermodesulfobacteriota bacterium]HRF90482.1 glutamine-hydrolyzing carbamoyl-phosphate synthase small subunit [Desulfobacter postgatei]MBP8829514.1 glutamine-hydrolyzing carbamoyl-phosphate synthase small subunit [Desulfobacter sp.]MBP9597870.1 glutamine-hydrolyzing carbamoyl-phosphate synthase small subunit [Desulfobacter sp.]HBT88987.1 carbamoyl phos